MCPRSSYPFCIVKYYIKWVTTSWTDNTGYEDLTYLFKLIQLGKYAI